MTNDDKASAAPAGARKDSLSADWVTATVGSGISTTEKIVKPVALVDLSPDDVSLLQAPPWSENQTMISSLFGEIYKRSHQCPGYDRPQCCGAKDHDTHCTPKILNGMLRRSTHICRSSTLEPWQVRRIIPDRLLMTHSNSAASLPKP